MTGNSFRFSRALSAAIAVDPNSIQACLASVSAKLYLTAAKEEA